MRKTELIWVASLVLSGSLNGATFERYETARPFRAYLESDVLRRETSPRIVRPGQYVHKGEQFLIDQEASQGLNEVWVEVATEWVEPAALTTPPGEVRVLKLNGEASVSLPSDPQTFRPVKSGDLYQPGTTLRVAGNSTLRLDLGGRHHVCLIPGTEAVIERRTGSQGEQVRVHLQRGAVISDVNLKHVPTEFTVGTPVAVAAARGTSFVTVALPEVTDVWIREGTVELLEPGGASAGTASVPEGGSSQIIRFPPSVSEKECIEANCRTLTAIVLALPLLSATPAVFHQNREHHGQGTGPDFQLQAPRQWMRYLLRVCRRFEVQDFPSYEPAPPVSR